MIKTKSFSILSILFTIFLLQGCKEKTKDSQINTSYGTFSNPDVAFTECKNILSNLSKTLNTTVENKQKTK
ncbi:hypothetical protein [Myroides pelagicus]|uniref:Lipoprotein n=1 Tax=Myroides pelagicus TaxID=270914 RepID=A0A7K1GMX8_9FLAO|nr:hypothetical protein [Myroides pelagicus]MEC4114558.1 hypothetical protein [Myroides pelagicus]MTH30181.1 hypothetical protein [Myroides pelagicus]